MDNINLMTRKHHEVVMLYVHNSYNISMVAFIKRGLEERKRNYSHSWPTRIFSLSLSPTPWSFDVFFTTFNMLPYPWGFSNRIHVFLFRSARSFCEIFVEINTISHIIRHNKDCFWQTFIFPLDFKHSFFSTSFSAACYFS
jgi:hypothetical protein